MNAAAPPLRCASAMACRARVVLPLDSGPYTSTTRPRGIPPMPVARSSASDPVEMEATGSGSSSSLSVITAPLPNCFSTAASRLRRARTFSTTCSSIGGSFRFFGCADVNLPADTARTVPGRAQQLPTAKSNPAAVLPLPANVSGHPGAAAMVAMVDAKGPGGVGIGTLPGRVGTSPVGIGTLPGGVGIGAAGIRMASVRVDTAPVDTGGLPVRVDTAPVDTGGLPVRVDTAPIDTGGLPVRVRRGPVDIRTAPGGLPGPL